MWQASRGSGCGANVVVGESSFTCRVSGLAPRRRSASALVLEILHGATRGRQGGGIAADPRVSSCLSHQGEGMKQACLCSATAVLRLRNLEPTGSWRGQDTTWRASTCGRVGFVQCSMILVVTLRIQPTMLVAVGRAAQGSEVLRPTCSCDGSDCGLCCAASSGASSPSHCRCMSLHSALSVTLQSKRDWFV